VDALMIMMDDDPEVELLGCNPPHMRREASVEKHRVDFWEAGIEKHRVDLRTPPLSPPPPPPPHLASLSAVLSSLSRRRCSSPGAPVIAVMGALGLACRGFLHNFGGGGEFSLHHIETARCPKFRIISMNAIASHIISQMHLLIFFKHECYLFGFFF